MSEDTQPAARWRVPPAQTALKVAATVVIAVSAPFYATDVQAAFLIGVAVVGGAVFSLRDFLAPVRLEADREGLTVVRGYARKVRLGWSEVVAVRVDERKRLLSKTVLLEIETADDLVMLSRFDLGADVRDVAEALERLGQAAPEGSGQEGRSSPSAG
ncbi:PH domain-containing protein [Actinomadura gamaensis]|uniref:PH domain-containing protein n=1 Tax=Actinomadura gamaensis TaxID=1763541 RepID=A0ABV9U0M1_9ACTN